MSGIRKSYVNPMVFVGSFIFLMTLFLSLSFILYLHTHNHLIFLILTFILLFLFFLVVLPIETFVHFTKKKGISTKVVVDHYEDTDKYKDGIIVFKDSDNNCFRVKVSESKDAFYIDYLRDRSYDIDKLHKDFPIGKEMICYFKEDKDCDDCYLEEI